MVLGTSWNYGAKENKKRGYFRLIWDMNSKLPEALKTSDNKCLSFPLSHMETTADWFGVRFSIGAGILLIRKASEQVKGNRQWID